jgi:RNA polymerase sigma-70 factor (sigma-E family)
LDAAAEERFSLWADARGDRLLRVAYLLCGDWHLAEDLVQDTLMQAAVHWKRVEAADNPDSYVRKILMNEARKRWRRRSSREMPHPEIRNREAITPDEADAHAARDELLAAIRQLPLGQRSALVFRYFEQLTEAETAQALNCSVGTVKSHTHRALSALRDFLNAEELPC